MKELGAAEHRFIEAMGLHFERHEAPIGQYLSRLASERSMR